MSADARAMDGACKAFIIIGVVVLLAMLVSENVGTRPRNAVEPAQQTSGTCGAMRVNGGASAKRAGRVGLVRGRTDQASSKAVAGQDFLSLADPWMNDSVKACEHKVKQDETTLSKDFSWEVDTLDPKVNEKFDALAIKEHDVKRKANIRAINPDMEYEPPTQAKTLGLSNPMHSIYHKNSVDQIEFGQSCSWFNASDAYYDARRRMAKNTCLSDVSDVQNPA